MNNSPESRELIDALFEWIAFHQEERKIYDEFIDSIPWYAYPFLLRKIIKLRQKILSHEYPPKMKALMGQASKIKKERDHEEMMNYLLKITKKAAELKK